MSEEDSRAYYLSRSARERELAQAAIALKIAKIHLEMAEEYERLAQSAADRSPELRLVGKPLNEQTRAEWHTNQMPVEA